MEKHEQVFLTQPAGGVVRRAKAEAYVLTTLVAFAASVIVTRVYLELTGYPQLGRGNLHIAHVLWGGLLLYVAALLPLIWLNRGALTWSALLSGVGVGLFIDEVGKFITRNVDYFYPPAAPIIYAFFLLSVLLYFFVRRPVRKNARAELYRAVEEFPALVDGVLLEQEQQEITERLTYARQSAEPRVAALAEALHAYLTDSRIPLPQRTPGPIQRVRAWVAGWGHKLGQQRHRRLILWLVGLHALLTVVGLGLLALLVLVPGLLTEPLGQVLVSDSALRTVDDRFWFLTHFSLQIISGLIAVWAFVWLWRGREEGGVKVALFGLTFSLTIIILLTFYLNQFGAIATALTQFVIFFVVTTYRQWYLIHPATPVR